jgi:hypothetical protein
MNHRALIGQYVAAQNPTRPHWSDLWWRGRDVRLWAKRRDSNVRQRPSLDSCRLVIAGAWPSMANGNYP